MNKTILLIGLLVILTNCQTVTIATTCSCSQMLTESDCGKKAGCSWNATTKACATSTTPTTPTDTATFATYCDQFNTADECPKKTPCAWDNKTCTHFTGCTAFVNDTDEKCQAISNRCITDGVRCVEKAACTTYLTSKSCVINNLGRYCYWNTADAANPKCEDADDCPKLPLTLGSDTLCKAQITKCTAKEGGGCIELGTKCADQVAEIGCVRDKSGGPCFWSKGKCLDKTCDFAPVELVTDQTCKDFISTCTTKLGGGCVTRSNCGSAIQAACVKNSSGDDCFWNGTACVDKTCANALASNKTNASCQSHLKKCITTGSGCIDNTGCDAATIKDACEKTQEGGLCHWDGAKCKTKICDNAGSLYVGHDQCTTFLPTCTAKVGAASGCEDRKCTNAPKTNTTNEQCEAYLPKGNCITQDGGGCRINTTCEVINLEQACKTDVNNKSCFWDSGKCLTRICTNAPASNNTHTLCNTFLNTCTVGSGSTCVDKTCENVQEEGNCNNDYLNKPCIFKGKCYQKQCALASKDFTTYDQCKGYLSTCTLDNSGSGCMDLPIKCEAITKTEGCQIKKGGGKCGLMGNNCVDQSCLTAPAADYATSTDCNTYKSGCVVDNDSAGCIDLPSTCSARKLQDNCQIEQTRSLTPLKCQWDAVTDIANPVCIDIKCENAHIVTLKGGVTQSGCWNYQSLKCVIDTTGNKCIPRPKACSGLAQDACNQSNVIQLTDSTFKNCYWDANSTSCKDIACANITLATYSHANCNNAIGTCTVNATSTKCQDLGACDKYTASDQCKTDTNGNECTFTGPNSCKDKSCAEAEDSTSYDSDTKCQTFTKKCTLTQKKCALKQTTCAAYKNQGACEANTLGVKQQCAWSSGSCANAGTVDCTKYVGTGFTLGYCQYLDSTCSVNSDGTACITATANCAGQVAAACVWASTDKYCYWTGADCAKVDATTKCIDIAGTSALICKSKKSSCTWSSGTKCSVNCADFAGPFNYDTCQAYDPKCTMKRDGTGCVATAATCAATSVANCTHSDQGKCILKSGTTCTYANGADLIAAGSCDDITGVGLTPAYCKGVSASGNTCSANSELTSCIEKEDDCASYLTPFTGCLSGISEKQCVMKSDNTACLAFVSGCNTVRLLKDATTQITYTNLICNLYGCKAKTDGSACEDITAAAAATCASYTGPVTYEACRGFLTTCSVNAAKNACVTAVATCAGYTNVADCGYATDEGECVVSAGTCVQKNCDSAAATVTTLAGCQAVSQNCVLRVGGCQFRAACASYLVQGACVKNASDGNCLWNPTAGKCVDKSCSAAEASANFDSHTKCLTVGKCTVKATADKAIGQGCIPYGTCASYTIEEQCKFNSKDEGCIWNTNTDPPTCADKSCATAPIASYTDHFGCSGYLTGCTVNVVDVSGTQTLQGCIALKPCSQYINEGQCKVSSEKDSNNASIQCGWNGTCANKSCLTAQETYNTPTLCSGYLSGCTVNATDNGCISIPEACEGMTQNQCFDGSVDKSSRKCYWDTTEAKCITKKCENSPNYGSESECDTYLPGCTTDAIKCKTKICEDFPLSTDTLCKAAILTCTSNGTNCVKRGTCSQALAEAGCVTDSSNKQCQWMTPSGQTAYCTNKTCATAPSTLTTETQCTQYFTPTVGSCTTKKDGGCTTKGACTSANVAAACTTDSTGSDCWWDTETNGCRLKECKDFSGSTHAACQKLKQGCTAGLNGKCAKMTNCQDIKVRAACIAGNDGPCLWIAKYVNADATLGACFSYESCKSLDWNSNSNCKMISPNCTTDGTGCIGITGCSATNVKGGCKTGTDGECIQTVSAKGAADTICKKFTSCSDAFYLTHDECNSANSNCTSDYSTGCIPLAACSSYSQNQCYRNKDGVQKDASGSITSTGICVWDETAKSCKDQQCSDLTYTSEAECSSRLKTCSSDGIKCLVKSSCSLYTTSAACNVAGGTEGACFFVTGADNQGTCRTKLCSDIPNGTTTQACQGVNNCVSNGTACIAKANCSTYTSKVACNSKGSDGICVWTETTTGGTTSGKCSLMTSCASAGIDSNACTQANDRCQFDTKTKSCIDHTCASYASQVSGCKFFLTWDQKKYNICSSVNNVCTATDAATLKEGDCYSLTAYLYSWNPTSSKCTQCGTVIVTPNNTGNNSSTGNETNQTESGYILGFTSIVVGLLMSS